LPSRSVIDGPCYDIGAGGLCVECAVAPDVGDMLQVRVHVPRLNRYSPGFFKSYENDAEQYVQCIAVVAWVRPSGGGCLVGVNFTDIDSDTHRALQNLIDKATKERPSEGG
jgi:hypothetical protein